ncbi:MAG: Na+/H+ antiporter NhaC [Oscillospiraceae bacterium]|nr:Na+/H+ antiporter NhaC [Oscillospiraceae bacterium]MCI9588715.1 Na+/H+ antiporter NhaC [Oscillospiraceae bacterium]
MKEAKKPSFGASLGVLLLLVALLIVGFGLKRINIQALLFITMFLISIISLCLGYKWADIQKAMMDGLMRGAVAMTIMFLIGMIIGSWIQCGTVPALIYYGLNILSPKIFLPAAFLICCVTSLATGTSWGSAGTVGLALMGIGMSMSIPAPIIAGAVVSGAFFGDKLSPLSDTTNLASATAEVDIYAHIKAMLYTSVPAMVVAIVLYAIIGLQYTGGSFDPAQITDVTGALSSIFNINILVILPAVVLLALSVMKVPAIPSMSIGVVLGIIVAVVFQGVPLTSVIGTLYSGFKIESGVAAIDTLLNRGGMTGMTSSIFLMIIALMLGGILSDLGYMQVIVETLLGKIKSVGTLIFATIFSGAACQATTCNTMVSIILTGTAFKGAYDEKEVDRTMLSRCLEEGSTLTAALIPWNTAGAYMATTLGVATVAYLPYTFFNLANILISIVLSYMGIFVFRKGQTSMKAAKKEKAAKK